MIQRESQLFQSVRVGDLITVQQLLDAGVNVNCSDRDQATPLMYAVVNHQLDMVNLLLSAGARVNQAKPPHQITALMLAAAHNRVEICDRLIQTEIELDAVNDDGSTALMVAAYKGHSVIVQSLLTAGANPHLIDTQGDSALKLAIQSKNLATIATLLQFGVDPNSGNVLLLATRLGQKEAVKLLLEKGADVNQANLAGETPLTLIAKQGDREIWNILRQFDVKLTVDALMTAAGEGQDEFVKTLIQAGLDIDTEDENGDTALHLACLEGHVSVVSALLALGANVNHRNHLGDTPLLIALLQDHPEIADQLLCAGANPHFANEEEMPVTLAVKNQQHKIIHLLLKAGVDPDTRFPDSKTLLMKAADLGDRDLVEILLQAGADVNLTDSTQATALMWASHRGYAEIVKTLIQIPAIDLDAKNRGGYTALMLASFNQYFDVVDILKKAGASEC
ncbi:MAG: ankyrin repeat domain-containing protein [Snowella sp.]|nr:ankyrin repeat domain-containing protein [Snowella sp.]